MQGNNFTQRPLTCFNSIPEQRRTTEAHSPYPIHITARAIKGQKKRALMCTGIGHVLVEEDSGADDKLEDVLQGFHGLQQLLRQLLGVVHIVLEHFGQLPKENTQGNKNAP